MTAIGYIAIGFVIVVVLGALYALYKVVSEIPRCPSCNSRYLDCVDHLKDLWGCRECLYRGPWSEFENLKGE